MTKRDRNKAIKKVERAIDNLIDVQVLGGGCETVSACLRRLNELLHCWLDMKDS